MTSATPTSSAPTPSGASTRPSTYPRRGVVLALRWILLLCWAFVVGVLYGGVSTLIGVAENSPDQLRDPTTWLGAFLLPKWLLAPDAPLALRIAVPVGILLVLVGCIWATRDLVQQARHEHRSVFAEMFDERVAEHYTSPALPTSVAPVGAPRSAGFVGREEELATLLQGLRAGTSMGVFALEGMGGVGKTALAAEAVSQLASDPSFPGGAVWVSCEGLVGADGLATIWSELGRQLDLRAVREATKAEERRVQLVQALAARPRTLLALDNLEVDLDSETLVSTLSIAGHTALLLTARQAIAPGLVTRLDLAPLPEPDAATLFRQTLARNDASRSSRSAQR